MNWKKKGKIEKGRGRSIRSPEAAEKTRRKMANKTQRILNNFCEDAIGDDEN